MFPDRSEAIRIHRETARGLAAEGRHSEARAIYLKWVESVRQQNVSMKGALENDLKEAQREYSEFAKSDPLYLKICESLLPIIRAKPVILQTDIYKDLASFSKGDLSYALYFAADHGKIIRAKKGRTYSLLLSE